MTDLTTNPDRPSPRVVARRLGSLRGVRREMARLYADARCGLLQPTVAAKLAYVLTCIQKAVEGETLEQRINQLEEAVSKAGGSTDARS